MRRGTRWYRGAAMRLRARALLLGAVLAAALVVPAASSAAGAQRKMHVGMNLAYSVTGSVTRITGISLSGLPKHWSVAVRCLGKGCFAHTWHYRWKRATAMIAQRQFSSGQKLVITFRSAGYAPAAFIVQILYESPPQVTLYKAPNPALARRIKAIAVFAGLVALSG